MSVASIDPRYAGNITVYHVNPASYGAAPINMDTADMAGDAFFDLRSVALPLECAESPHSSDCTNPEVTSDDLVITKLVLEVDKRYGQYGFCNVCVNGSAGISGSCSTEGAYVCSCWHHGGDGGYVCYHNKCYPSHHGYENQTQCESTCVKSGKPGFMTELRSASSFPTTPCNASVGRENITQFFGQHTCSAGSANWECWRDNVAKKTGGLWFSTVDTGYCGEHQSDDCTWRVVEVTKVINKTCSDNSVYNAIEAADKQKCFESCGGVGKHRNTTDACWITCFYSTLLGPDAGHSGGKVDGLPLEDLLAAWDAPFSSEDETKGGCKALSYTMHGVDEPSYPDTMAAAAVASAKTGQVRVH